jgi:hypothetical protein
LPGSCAPLSVLQPPPSRPTEQVRIRRQIEQNKNINQYFCCRQGASIGNLNPTLQVRRRRLAAPGQVSAFLGEPSQSF